MLEIKNVTKKFKDGTLGADKITLTFPDTGLIWIKGESGSGKTTLLRLIAGIYSYDEGEIFYNGERIENIKQYRSKVVGMIAQDFNLFRSLTVEENGNFFSKCQELFPYFEIDKIQNKKIDEISGGEARRVSIVRALNRAFNILLCDEPLESLDKENAEKVVRKLKDLSNDHLIIIASHIPQSLEETFDGVVELESSKVSLQVFKEKEKNKETKRILRKSNLFCSLLKNTFSRMRNSFTFSCLSFFILFIACFICFSALFIVTIETKTIEMKSLLHHFNRRISFQVEELNKVEEEFPILQYAYHQSFEELFPLHEKSISVFFPENIPLSIAKIDTHTFIKRDKIRGKTPTIPNEILLTEYTFECFKQFGLEEELGRFYPQNMEDLIGKKIKFYGHEVIISGVLEQNTKEYQFLKKVVNPSGREQELYYQLFQEDILPYNMVYVTEDFMNSISLDKEEPSLVFINTDDYATIIRASKKYSVTTVLTSSILELQAMIDSVKSICVILFYLSVFLLSFYSFYYLYTLLGRSETEIKSMVYLGLSSLKIIFSYLLEVLVISFLAIASAIILYCVIGKFGIDLFESYFYYYVQISLFNKMRVYGFLFIYSLILLVLFLFLFIRVKKIRKEVEKV